MSLASNHILVLDRDGLINKKLGYREYLSSPAQVEYLPGVKEGMQRLAQAGFCFVVATVQMGIALGKVTRAQVDSVNQWITNDLARDGVRVLGWFVCPHTDEDGCACRKPKPGLLVEAARALRFSPEECWNVGDSPRDILMGVNAGCSRNIMVESGYAPRPEEYAAIDGTPLVKTFADAVTYILEHER